MKALKWQLRDVVFGSESMDALWWVRGRSRDFKPFVTNRVGVIQTQINPTQLHYVPTKENPSDVASRGSGLKNLLEEELWWQGPNFLQKEAENWPDNKLKGEAIATEERKNNLTMLSQHVSFKDKELRLNPTRFSS